MNGIISRTLAALALGSSLTAVLGGCVTSGASSLCGSGSTCSTNCGTGSGVTGEGLYRKLVDPCYPERYWAIAHQNTEAVFSAQVGNGHVLDQTIWNYHFETGTDKLTPGGREHLSYLARRRPAPDPRVFLQTAQDVVFDPEKTDKFVADRQDLDSKRAAAMRSFLQAYTAGRNVNFEVIVHDPGDITLGSIPVLTATSKMYGNFQGVLPAGQTGSGASR